MTCQDYAEALALYAGDDLPADATERLEEHLRACASCRRQLSSLQETRRALRQAAAWDEDDESALAAARATVGRKIAELETEPAPHPRLGWLPRRPLRQIVGLAAAAVLAFGMHDLLFRGAERPAPEPQETEAIPSESPETGPNSTESPHETNRDAEIPASQSDASPRIASAIPPVAPPTSPVPEPVPSIPASRQRHDPVPSVTTRPALSEATVPNRPSQPETTVLPAREPAWIKLVSDDLVIYWLVEPDKAIEETPHASSTT